MTSNKINIVIEQGASFHNEFSLLDDNGVGIDLSAYTGAAKLRKTYHSANSFDFAVTLSTGLLTLDMADTLTATIPDGFYVYDAYLYVANTAIRVLEGTATVTGSVTR